MKKIIQLLLILLIFLISSLPAYGHVVESSFIAGGIVPHHLLAKVLIEDFFGYIARQKHLPDIVILLSPDHFNNAILEKDTSFITVNWENGHQKFCNIPVELQLLKELSSTIDIKKSSDIVLSEFGVTNLLLFIKKYLPQTNVIPIIISRNTSQEEVEQLVNTIHTISPSYTMLIASADFSHYLPAAAAEFHDTKSIRVLLNFEHENFKNIEVDSWQSLYAARLFAKLRKSEKATVFAHKNSVDFLPCELNSTTSYFSVIFQKGRPQKNLKVKTVLLAGDMMLGRGIEKLMKENSIYYPFQKIVQLLRGVDVVFANLEGPLVENVQENSVDESKFTFRPKVLEAVRWSQLNLLSLANNHIMDSGKESLEETIDWLRKYQINFVGSPLAAFANSTNIKNSYFSSEQTVFLAFNRVLPYIDYQIEIIKKIKKTRQSNLEKIIIVSIHWGNEYESISSAAQRDLAQQIIAAGADIIVGHHPHVVQEIELIQGRPVFYSLGNFIFDRQVLPETREGLIVGLTIRDDKLSFRLFPIKNKAGQPLLMSQSETDIFLNKLAQKSDKRLWENIKKGIIEINRIK